MPSIKRIGPYNLSFYAGDELEPPHVHVKRDRQEVKFWLDPIDLAVVRGFSPHELTRIRRLVDEHHAYLLKEWNDFFSI